MNRCFRMGSLLNYEHIIFFFSQNVIFNRIENFFEPQILHRKLNNMENVVVPTKCNIIQQWVTIHSQLFSNISCMFVAHTYMDCWLWKMKKLQWTEKRHRNACRFCLEICFFFFSNFQIFQTSIRLAGMNFPHLSHQKTQTNFIS